MALKSSAELMEAAAEEALAASELLAQVLDVQPFDPCASLDRVEEQLISVLAQVRAARWGIARRNPSFDSTDLTIVLLHERLALAAAHGYIPGRTHGAGREVVSS